MSDNAAISGLLTILSPAVPQGSPAVGGTASGDFLARLVQLVDGMSAEMLPEMPVAPQTATSVVPPTVQQALAMLRPSQPATPENVGTEEAAEDSPEEELATETAEDDMTDDSDTTLLTLLTAGILPQPLPPAPELPDTTPKLPASANPPATTRAVQSALPMGQAGVETQALSESIPFPLNQFAAGPAAHSQFSVLDEPPPVVPMPAQPTTPVATTPSRSFVFTGPIQPISRIEAVAAVTAVAPAPRSAFPVLSATPDVAMLPAAAPLPIPQPALPAPSLTGALEGELLPGVATYNPPWAQMLPVAVAEDVTPEHTAAPSTSVPPPVVADEAVIPVAATAAQEQSREQRASDEPVIEPSQPPPVQSSEPARPAFTIDRPAVTHRTDAHQVIAQVATAVRHHISGEMREMQIRLDPPELGMVHLQVIVRGEEMVAQLQASSPIARDLLEARLPELRERLQEAGLTISSCTVSLNAQQGQGDPRQPWPATAPPAPQPGGQMVAEPLPAPEATPRRSSSGLLDYLA